MTQAQKIAKEKFKKAIEYRKKTGATLKEAFAFVYGRKVSPVKKKAAPKKKAAVKKKAAPKKKAAARTIREKKIAGFDKDNILHKINYSAQLQELYNDKLNFLSQIKPSNAIDKKNLLKDQKMYFELLKIERERIKELKKHI